MRCYIEMKETEATVGEYLVDVLDFRTEDGRVPPREFSRPEVAKVLIEAMRPPVA